MYQQGPLSQYAHKPNELYEHQVAFMRCKFQQRTELLKGIARQHIGAT
jgi:hypothetical protein